MRTGGKCNTVLIINIICDFIDVVTFPKSLYIPSSYIVSVSGAMRKTNLAHGLELPVNFIIYNYLLWSCV